MKRKYDQYCGMAAALDLIGDRWALFIVRDLLFSPKRFTDLLAGLPGIGTNTLTVRLAELESARVLCERVTPPPMPSTAYVLTDRGRSLLPVLIALARWGAPELMRNPPDDPIRAPSLGVAMLACFQPSALGGNALQVALEFPGGGLTVDAGPDGVKIVEGVPVPAAESSRLTVVSDPGTVLNLLLGRVSPAAAMQSGTLRVHGAGGQLEQFLRAFPMGPPRG